MPLFTIITINLNNLHGLKRTMESVFCQNFSDFEYIVVDGVSEDGSIEWIKSQEKNISHIIIEKDKGVYDAMNKGLHVANGRYIQFLNSGDAFNTPDALSKFAENLHDMDLIFSDVELMHGDRLTPMFFPDQLNWRFQMTDMICHQAIFASSELFRKTGEFNIDYKIYADYDWLMKSLRVHHATYHHLNAILIRYEAGGLSETTNKERQKMEKDKIHDMYFSPWLVGIYRLYRKMNYFLNR